MTPLKSSKYDLKSLAFKFKKFYYAHDNLAMLISIYLLWRAREMKAGIQLKLKV